MVKLNHLNYFELLVGNSVSTLSFVLLEHDDHDTLLGLDWFAQSHVGFYPNKKILKFPRYPDYLNDDLDDEETIDLFISEEHDDIDIEGETSWVLDHFSCHDIKPGAKLSARELKIFMEMVNRIGIYVASKISELGKCNLIRHKINTSNEVPIFIPAYRKSQAEREYEARMGI